MKDLIDLSLNHCHLISEETLVFLYLKELRNYNRKVFLCPLQMYTLAHQAKCLHMDFSTKIAQNKHVATSRSSHQRRSVNKGILRNFATFTGKRLCQSLFFNKVAGPRPAILLKKRLWHRRFPVNVVKFLRTPFLQNTSGRLLLY